MQGNVQDPRLPEDVNVGSRFYDVKQVIAPLSIGGKTIIGQKLKDVILWQLSLEDSIPKVCTPPTSLKAIFH